MVAGCSIGHKYLKISDIMESLLCMLLYIRCLSVDLKSYGFFLISKLPKTAILWHFSYTRAQVSP